MKILNYFRRSHPGVGINRIFPCSEQNKVYNILETMEGEGCSIVRPLDGEGKGWKILVDGYSSDSPPRFSMDGLMPFDAVHRRLGTQIYIEGATVILDNETIRRRPGIEGKKGDNKRFTELTYPDKAFLVVERREDDEKRLEWYISSHVPYSAFWSLQVCDKTFQLFHGCVSAYSCACAPCLEFNEIRGRYSLARFQTGGRLDSLDSLATLAEHISLLCWDGGRAHYLQALGLFSRYESSVEERLRDEYVTPSQGDWEFWRQYIDTWLSEYLPFQAPCTGDGKAYLASGGNWVEMTDKVAAELHLPPASDISDLPGRLDTLQAKLEEIQKEMDGETFKQELADAEANVGRVTSNVGGVYGRISSLLNAAKYANLEARWVMTESDAYDALLTDQEQRLSVLEAKKEAQKK